VLEKGRKQITSAISNATFRCAVANPLRNPPKLHFRKLKKYCKSAPLANIPINRKNPIFNVALLIANRYGAYGMVKAHSLQS